MTLDWHPIGHTSPLHVASAPGVSAVVERGEGGKWVGTLTLRVEAGDHRKAMAKVEAAVQALRPIGFVRDVPDGAPVEDGLCG